MKNKNYQLNCDDYVLHEDGIPIQRLLPCIAIAFAYDKADECWILYKHGDPDHARSWLEKMKNQSSGVGIASEIHILEGKLPIDLVNKSLENPQLLGELVKHCLWQAQYTDYAQKSWYFDGVPVGQASDAYKHLFSVSRALDIVTKDVTDVVIKQPQIGLKI